MRLRCSLLALALAACGSDTDSQCTSAMTYQTVGAPYLASWCTGCHSADLPASMRRLAPTSVNLDNVDDVRALRDRVTTVIGTGQMPPEGGPSADEKQLMLTWLGCGAP